MTKWFMNIFVCYRRRIRSPVYACNILVDLLSSQHQLQSIHILTMPNIVAFNWKRIKRFSTSWYNWTSCQVKNHLNITILHQKDQSKYGQIKINEYSDYCNDLLGLTHPPSICRKSWRFNRQRYFSSLSNVLRRTQIRRKFCTEWRIISKQPVVGRLPIVLIVDRFQFTVYRGVG